jgi:colicin import membrane protein
LATLSKEAQERADSNFKKKEIQAREASKAMAEYEAARSAEREKTARLKLLREAKEAADAVAKAQAKAAGVAQVKEAAEAKASKAAAKLALGAAKKPAKPAKKRARAMAEADAEEGEE